MRLIGLIYADFFLLLISKIRVNLPNPCPLCAHKVTIA
jgi:hypothetical protein